MRHPEWEADVMLEGLWFKFLRGRDRTRVSWKPEYKARLELELMSTASPDVTDAELATDSAWKPIDSLD